jgi:phosphoglucomutase
MAVEQYILERANKWLEGDYDEITKAIKDLMDTDEEELTNAFYQDLEFGTGGLRGVMGVGTNRMNKYTVGSATQGLANYLLKTYPGEKIKVAISYDCRLNNTFFAETTANVLTANGIEVYLFDDLRPTPELSFAIRHLGCHSGVMITASHNPKEYNGYKAYWNDGAQIIPPHDKNIINEVKNITDISQVKFDGKDDLLFSIGKEIDEAFLKEVKSRSLAPDIIQAHSDLKIVYTPIHGTGVKMVPAALKAYGFTNIINVPEQDIVDGNFPTVHSPNPEEAAALNLGIEKAKETGAGLVMASDPDADRVGIAVRDANGEFVLLNGNETATLLTYYLLKQWKEKGFLKGREFMVKTIVTTELLKEITDSFQVPLYNTLTGFKWIAGKIRELEGKQIFIAGGEESYSFMIGDFVRDKDAITSCAMIAETAAWAANKGKSLYQLLADIYKEFSFYREGLVSVVRKGKKGADEIKSWMENYRANPPAVINGSKVVQIMDYQSGESKNLVENKTAAISLPQSNVLQFLLEDGTKITMRPSGTEPKIKYYFSVKGQLEDTDEFNSKKQALDAKIDAIIRDMKIER